MEHALAFLNSALEWVNNPTIKSILLMVGAFLWNRNSATINKAIPAVTMIASMAAGFAQLLVAAIAALFPQAGVHSVAYESAMTIPLTNVVGAALFGTLIPVTITIGTHSWTKNLLEWLADGAKFIRKK